MPAEANPNLLVGFETSDDAGVYKLSANEALVQTVDFFTPIVDDPYAYGAIAAANSLSDIYAMGGRPLTVLNIACFDPDAAPPEVWAAVLKGAHDKTKESGAVVMGGHTVIDKEPKFGMAVTGLVNPKRMFANTEAKPGDRIYLSKPLGTGIVTTAAKNDQCPPETLARAIVSMMSLNRAAADLALEHGVRCATDITGYGLIGHLYNVARASKVRINIKAGALPLLPNLEELAVKGMTTAGGTRNAEHVGERLSFENVPDWLREVVADPQTSGGLAIFTPKTLTGYPCIGEVELGEPSVRVTA